MFLLPPTGVLLYVYIHTHTSQGDTEVLQSIPLCWGPHILFTVRAGHRGRVRRMGQWEGWGPIKLQNTPQTLRCEQKPGSHPGPDVRWRQPRSHVPRTDHGPRLKLGRRGRWEASCQ